MELSIKYKISKQKYIIKTKPNHYNYLSGQLKKKTFDSHR